MSAPPTMLRSPSTVSIAARTACPYPISPVVAPTATSTAPGVSGKF